MSGLTYVENILKKYKVHPAIALEHYKFFLPYLKEWANGYLVEVKISGSSKKGTAVSSGTDVDLFISLTSGTNNTLNEIYESLYTYMNGKGFVVRRQNVSIGVEYNGYQIDLVPARRQSQYGNDHSLYVSKKNTWTKTNIDTHISKILRSERLDEIRLLKIWRNQNNVDFPSFYIELIVIDALRGCSTNATDRNFIKVLEFIANSLENNVYMDPANSNNCISNQISQSEKKRIANLAFKSSQKEYWKDIIS